LLAEEKQVATADAASIMSLMLHITVKLRFSVAVHY